MNILIVGAGKVGRALTQVLCEEKHNVVVVDTDEDLVERLVNDYDIQGISGNGTHCDVLREADVKNTYLIIATTPSDEINILTCMIARKMGARHAIARVRSPEYVKQIDFMRDELGLSRMINPDFYVANEIARVLQFPAAANIETFAGGRIDMIEVKIKAGNPIIDHSLKEISDKYKGTYLICAVKRGSQVYIPNGDFIIHERDVIYITGTRKVMANLFKKLGIFKNTVKKVMIVGGSRIAQFLAAQLIIMGIKVSIVEKNPERCAVLTDRLPDAAIVCGNSHDHKLLLEEGITDIDAIATLTDSDEENFLISMYAGNLGINKVVTKINEPAFAEMLDKAGLDSAVSITEVISETIVQYLRSKHNSDGTHMINLYKLFDGQVEAMEFFAGQKAKNLNIPLKDVKFKKDLLIAAIIRRHKIIFPTGEECLMEDDRIIVVAKSQGIEGLNDIFA